METENILSQFDPIMVAEAKQKASQWNQEVQQQMKDIGGEPVELVETDTGCVIKAYKKSDSPTSIPYRPSFASVAIKGGNLNDDSGKHLNNEPISSTRLMQSYPSTEKELQNYIKIKGTKDTIQSWKIKIHFDKDEDAYEAINRIKSVHEYAKIKFSDDKEKADKVTVQLKEKG